MALGDWLNPDAETNRDRLRADLQEIDLRLQELEKARGALYWLTTAPTPDTGRDGDGAIDTLNGNFYVRVAGAWQELGAFWLDRSGVA